jgi:hypothetical protein
MPAIAELLLAELEREAAGTRRRVAPTEWFSRSARD